MKTCEEMMGKDDRIISANSSYSDEKDFKYMVASNGFEGEACGSSFSLVASVSIRGEGDARPESYWYDSSLYFDTMIKEGLGTKALNVFSASWDKSSGFRQISHDCRQYEFRPFAISCYRCFIRFFYPAEKLFLIG